MTPDSFYLGIHHPHWLADARMVRRRAFVSRRTFLDSRTGRYRKAFPRAVGRYAVDSGGFTEVQKFGRWMTSAAEYADFLARLREETGPYDFASPRDWMCEPAVIAGGSFAGGWFHGTGTTLGWHQRQTVRDFLDLRARAPQAKIIPVLQGWERADYLRCARMYRTAGVDLGRESVVGIGSVCRRQHMGEAADIIAALLDDGVRNLHGFGFKIIGLRNCWDQLTTADSMAWSVRGRRSGRCPHAPYARGVAPKNCGNCLTFALGWADANIKPPVEMDLAA